MWNIIKKPPEATWWQPKWSEFIIVIICMCHQQLDHSVSSPKPAIQKWNEKVPKRRIAKMQSPSILFSFLLLFYVLFNGSEMQEELWSRYCNKLTQIKLNCMSRAILRCICLKQGNNRVLWHQTIFQIFEKHILN